MCKHAQEKIKEIKSLAADLCNQCAQDCRGRLRIMDSQIEAFRELMRELDQKLSTLEQALNQLRALYRVNVKLISLIAPEKENRNRDNGPIKTNYSKPTQRKS